MHAAAMWLFLTKWQEGHLNLESKGVIRGCSERLSDKFTEIAKSCEFIRSADDPCLFVVGFAEAVDRWDRPTSAWTVCSARCPPTDDVCSEENPQSCPWPATTTTPTEIGYAPTGECHR